MKPVQQTAIDANGWHLWPSEPSADERWIEAVRALHITLERELFATDPMANRRLGVEVRAFRRLEDWRVLLVLTPWMLARLLAPLRQPASAIPEGWRAPQRRDACHQVLGPTFQLDILGQSQAAHLNYHPILGHYLLQPIALNLEPYDSAEAVFQSWGEVIRTRDENMQRHRKDCAWQKEISRRELFARLRPRA